MNDLQVQCPPPVVAANEPYWVLSVPLGRSLTIDGIAWIIEQGPKLNDFKEKVDRDRFSRILTNHLVCWLWVIQKDTLMWTAKDWPFSLPLFQLWEADGHLDYLRLQILGVLFDRDTNILPYRNAKHAWFVLQQKEYEASISYMNCDKGFNKRNLTKHEKKIRSTIKKRQNPYEQREPELRYFFDAIFKALKEWPPSERYKDRLIDLMKQYDKTLKLSEGVFAQGSSEGKFQIIEVDREKQRLLAIVEKNRREPLTVSVNPSEKFRSGRGRKPRKSK